jgi:hypothetical protein
MTVGGLSWSKGAPLESVQVRETIKYLTANTRNWPLAAASGAP